MSEEIHEDEGGELLVSLDDYLSSGVHLGLKYKVADMGEFIYKTRQDKLSVFDVRKIDERIKIATDFISRYDPKDVLVVSNRIYGRKAIKKFAEYTGCTGVASRFISGTLTNPNIKSYIEPKLLIVTDPSSDKQAIKEASVMGVPIIAICDTNTRIRNIDFIIPSNNKGKSSLALIYWILTRDVLKKRGIDTFDASMEDFVSQAEPQPYLIKMQEIQRRYRMKRKKRRR